MAINVEQYKALKDKAARAKTEADRAEGALQAKMKQLKDEFGCDTLEEAETLLAEKNKALAQSEADYERELFAFQEKWGKLLDV